jgi:hypothetical protein
LPFGRSALHKSTCYIDENRGLYLVDGVVDETEGVAWAVFDDGINETGWYKLVVKGREGADSKDMMRCAGYLEGHLSQKQIYQHYQLAKDIHSFERGKWYPKNWTDFMDANRIYTEESVQAYQDEPYWQEVGLILTQFHGLVDGYNARAPADQKLNETDFWFIHAECEIWDVERAIDVKSRKKHSEAADHCTGLIRLLDDYSDVFFAQDTWSDYRDLHGQLKEYNFPIKEFKASRLIFSTRVGKIFSYDDFYMADTGLLVLETTMSIYNESLYDLVTPKKLFTWVRALRAMWVATNGSYWAETFIKHNSGTLNNQYIILDTNKFVKGKKPTSDLLWQIEQYPGTYESRDLTQQLVRDGYIPSINVPSTERLYKLAGYPEKVASMGELGYIFSYYESPRYLILKRDAPRVKTFDEFKELMTYNNYKKDPYSYDASHAIMSRYDLRRGDDPRLPKKAFGGLDSKCTRLTEFRTKMKVHAIAGPTRSNGIPAWDFSNQSFGVLYDGLPARWEFSWIQHNSSTGYNYCNATTVDTCNDQLCGWCTYTQKCMPGDKKGPFFDEKCPNGWVYTEPLQPWAIPVIITVSVITVIIVAVIFASHYLKKKDYEQI